MAAPAGPGPGMSYDIDPSTREVSFPSEWETVTVVVNMSVRRTEYRIFSRWIEGEMSRMQREHTGAARLNHICTFIEYFSVPLQQRRIRQMVDDGQEKDTSQLKWRLPYYDNIRRAIETIEFRSELYYGVMEYVRQNPNLFEASVLRNESRLMSRTVNGLTPYEQGEAGRLASKLRQSASPTQLVQLVVDACDYSYLEQLKELPLKAKINGRPLGFLKWVLALLSKREIEVVADAFDCLRKQGITELLGDGDFFDFSLSRAIAFAPIHVHSEYSLYHTRDKLCAMSGMSDTYDSVDDWWKFYAGVARYRFDKTRHDMERNRKKIESSGAANQLHYGEAQLPVEVINLVSEYLSGPGDLYITVEEMSTDEALQQLVVARQQLAGRAIESARRTRLEDRVERIMRRPDVVEQLAKRASNYNID